MVKKHTFIIFCFWRPEAWHYSHWAGNQDAGRVLGEGLSPVLLGDWHNAPTVVVALGSLFPCQLSAEDHCWLLEVNTCPQLNLVSALLPFSRAVSSLIHGWISLNSPFWVSIKIGYRKPGREHCWYNWAWINTLFSKSQGLKEMTDVYIFLACYLPLRLIN